MLHISTDTGHVITGLSLLDAGPQYLGPDGYLAMCRLWCNWRKSLFNEKKHRHIGIKCFISLRIQVMRSWAFLIRCEAPVSRP